MSSGMNLPGLRQLEDRQVEIEVAILALSPKVDILALANKAGQIILYRLKWIKIWSYKRENDLCTSLCWRPDGKLVCAGFASGAVIILDVDSSQTIHTNQWNSGASKITSLHWTLANQKLIEEDDDRDQGHQRGQANSECEWDFLTKFPILSKAYSSNMEVLDEVSDCQKLHDGGQPTILVVGDHNGVLSVYMNGFLLSAEINVNSIVGYNCIIESATASSDLTSIVVVVREKEAHTTRILTLAVPIITSCFNEFNVLSKTFILLSGTMDYLSETITQVKESWESLSMEMDSKLANLAKKLNHPSGLSAHFLDLLLYGYASPDLEGFLIGLPEKSVKKLSVSIDASYVNLEKLVLKYLHSVTRSVNAFLADLKGVAEARGDKMEEVVGVKAQTISKAIKAASSFWAKGCELQQVTEYTRQSFSMFFGWLHVQIVKVANDDSTPDPLWSMATQQGVRNIAEFLANFDMTDETEEEPTMTSRTGHRHIEMVGQYLKDANLKQTWNLSQNPWMKFLEENPDIMKLDEIVQLNREKSLVQEHNSLTKCIEAIFKGMNTDMTDRCKIVGSVPVTDKFLGCRQFESVNCPEKVMGLIMSEPDEPKIYYYEVDGGEKLTKFNSIWLTIGNSKRLVDTQFYTTDILSVLVEDTSGTGDSQRLIQLQLDKLSVCLKPVSLNLLQNGVHNAKKVYKDVFSLADQSCLRDLDGLNARLFSVSGPRNMAACLFRNQRRIRIYDMEIEDEDEDEDEDDE